LDFGKAHAAAQNYLRDTIEGQLNGAIMKKLLSLILAIWVMPFCGMFHLSHADEGDLLWDRSFGGDDWDEAQCVVQTPDGGYALAGMTQTYGAGLQDMWLVKTNAAGDTLWTRTYGGPSYDNANALIVAQDGGLLLVGSTQSYGAGSNDFWAVKTDENGDTLWTQTYGDEADDYGEGVVQLEDDGFALVGSRYFGSGNVLLIRTDAEGNQIWSRHYGGFQDERGHAIAATADGGFLLNGETGSYGAGYADAWMLQVDAVGDSLWSQTFGGAGFDYGYWGTETGDGYVLAGTTGSFGAGSNDAWMAKADLQGDSIWAFPYGTNEIEYAYAATQTADAFLLTGLYNETFEPGQVYLVKTDLNGIELWSETYGDSLLDDLGFSVIQNSDGDYIIAGRSSTPAPSGNYEMYLLAVDGSGTGIEPAAEMALGDFALYPAHPNPFNATTAINFQLSANSHVSLRLYDTAGRLAEILVNGWRTAGRHEVTFDATDLPSGIYLARLMAGDLTQTQKLILLK
jgi:hypothetical protein